MNTTSATFAHTTATTLLVVEDERIVALDMKLTLESLGFHVVGTASTQDEAVVLTMSYRPDLILMDINLGKGGDGILAAQEIARFADVPIVFLTAYADSDILRRAEQVAPYGYLVKPVRQRELNATVQMALARVRASRARIQAERRLRLALDAAKMGVLTLNDGVDLVEIDGHFPPVADGSVRGLRIPVGEFLLHLSEDAQAKVQRLLDHGGDLHIVARWRSPGTELPDRWLEVHASYVANEFAVVGICRDVTRQIEQEESARQATVVFESAADAILILDTQGRVMTANPAFVKLTGWPTADIRGRHPNEFLHARRGSDRELLDTTPVDVLGHAEVVCLRHDGSTFPAWEHVAPVRDDSGSITNRVLTFTDISALRDAENRIQHLAYHDPLTGLGNRNQLRDLLSALPPPQSGDNTVALMFLDLDGFKVINDSLGHDKGDALLIAIADRFRRVLRLGDQAIRLGGDEFLMLIRSGRDSDVNVMAKRLLEVVRQPFDLAAGSSVQVSASIGIAFHPSDGSTPDALLRAADIAMYAAKEAGRNRYARYHPKMAEVANERLAIEQGLLLAMENGELSVHWQPQVSIDGLSLVGAEALLRWHSGKLGSIGPDRFIPVAEECGLIQPLGRWVLRQALITWTQWQRDGFVQGRLAVNVSALQLQDDQFAEDLVRELKATGMDPKDLEIEVTETALQRVPHVEHRLGRIAELGVKIALDDFGTGYSSLSMLKLLPLHRLKVDRAFVRDVVGNPSDQAIVRAIAAMADALGLELIAEGVEDRPQQDCLTQIGVQEAQGWLYGRAMSAPDFLAWLGSR
ncbi:EAL domain-containing protein [Paucibacter sp. Y2R2-4]|uniref:two-component system response regulator n=1 Tax=Paucibacter sp. Y2R2-4 TaxID=2893553 RepID=UPI0021E485EA|nr:EAL domain-containing protein [Paucibacter sp. Y2R2-4]MCV2351812.1 EAL domain-containing protein [Paucibacter sp. Y2R2-4]